MNKYSIHKHGHQFFKVEAENDVEALKKVKELEKKEEMKFNYGIEMID